MRYNRFIKKYTLQCCLSLCLLIAPLWTYADSPPHRKKDEEEKQKDCKTSDQDNKKKGCKKDKKDCDDGTCSDPFYLFNGEFYWDKGFLSQSDSPLNLGFRIRYSTYNEYNGFAGNGWVFNYNMRVFETDMGKLVVRDHDGLRTVYELVSGGLYRSANVYDEHIEIQTDGSYILTLRSQISYHFDVQGRLTKIADTTGNELRIQYDGNQLHPVTGLPLFTNLELAQSTDLGQGKTEPMVLIRDYRIASVEEYSEGVSTDRKLTYTYNAEGRLEKVVDHNNRKVHLVYDAAGVGDLIMIADETGRTYDFDYYNDANNRTYYRFMRSFSGDGCSACTKHFIQYYDGLHDDLGGNGRKVRKMIEGESETSPIGEVVEVTAYGADYTDLKFTIYRFDASGNIIGMQERQERVEFIDDVFGEKRLSRRLVQSGATFGDGDDWERSYEYFDATSPSHLQARVSKIRGPEGYVNSSDQFVLTTKTFSYDTNGNETHAVERVDDSRIRVTYHQYDANNNQTREEIFYADGTGDVAPDGTINIGTPLGQKFVTVWEYDSLNRRTAEKRLIDTSLPETDANMAKTEWTYFDDTSKIKTRTGPRVHTASGSFTRPETTFEYDDVNAPFSPTKETTISLVMEFTYDAYGFLASQKDELDRTTTFVNDAIGRVTEVTDPLGQKTVNSYETGSPNLTSVESGVNTADPTRKTVFTYDALNRRIATARVDENDAAIPQTKWSYDSEGRIVSRVVVLKNPDDDNNYTREVIMEFNDYDPQGNLIQREVPHPDGTDDVSVSTFVYDAANRQVQMTDPLGSVTTFEYDGLDRLIKRTDAVGTADERSMSFEYDADGNRTKVTYTGITAIAADGTTTSSSQSTYYTYDGLGRQIGINWDFGTDAPRTDGARELPRKMSYDPAGNVLSQTDGLGRSASFIYDVHGRLVETHYPITQDKDGNDIIAIDKRKYDAVGNVTRSIDARGISTYFNYDALNRLTHTSLPQASGQALTGNWWAVSGNVLRTQSYNAFGQVIDTSNVEEGTTSQTYDRFGRVITSTSASGLTMSYAYDNLDQRLTTTYPELNAGEGSTTETSVYNAINPNLLDAIIDRSGNQTSFSYTLRFRQKTITGSYDPDLSDSLLPITTFTYDTLGRRIAQTNALGETQSFNYDQFGQIQRIVHPDHNPGVTDRIETRSYNDYGLMTAQDGAGQYPVSFTYDLAGNRSSMMTHHGASSAPSTSTWQYDARNRVSRKTFSDSSFYAYSYDAAGNLVARTDGEGVQTLYSYNTFNLLEYTNYANDDDVYIEYDNLGRRIKMTRQGALESASDQEWKYDTASRITRHVQRLSGYELNYAYNAENKRESVSIHPIGDNSSPRTITYAYDNASRLTNITDTDVSSTENFSYTYYADSNLLAQRSNPGGSKELKTYDILGRLKSIEGQDSNSTAINQHTWAYDAAGQRTQETLLGGATKDYTYDEKRQLDTASSSTIPSFNYDYDFDDIGNRLSVTENASTTSYTPNALNQYSSIGGARPSYDLNGSLTAHNGISYTWNDENRLVAVADATKSSSYTYNGQGFRIRSIEKTGATTDSITWYVYDGNLPILEVDNTGNALRSYTRGLDLVQTLEGTGGVGSLLAITVHDSNIAPIGSAYYFYDGNGNVEHLLDTNDILVASYSYDPFGKKLSQNGTHADANPYQFSTKEYETRWNLNYYGFRYYDAGLGRWLSRDPIEEYSFFFNTGISLFFPRNNLNNLSSSFRNKLIQNIFFEQLDPNEYAFVENGSINQHDLLGLTPSCNSKSRVRKGGNGCEYRTKTADSSYSAQSNGCGASGSILNPPDSVGGIFDFSSACDDHDICYGKCGSSKTSCDDVFLQDMRSSCNAARRGGPRGPINQLACRALAQAFYQAVLKGGKGAFESAQDDACLWKPCCGTKRRGCKSK